MKFLPLVALLCAMMALSGAVAGSRVVKRSTSCPFGWTAINGRCFIYVPRRTTWAEAEKHCLSMDGHLASVHSAREYHVIQMLILSATHGQQEAWLGASDAQQEGYWFWSDGTKFLYSHWCPGEPNNSGNQQHCLLMNFSGAKCWDDMYCNRHHPSVCTRQA